MGTRSEGTRFPQESGGERERYNDLILFKIVALDGQNPTAVG